MNNIIIIGNGFDLAHGLKTSYTDFIKFIEKDMLVNPEAYQDLITMGEEFRANYDKLKPILNRNNSSSPLLSKTWNNSLFQDIFHLIAEQNWCDIESLYYQKLYTSQDPKKLNEEFEVIKNHLQNYLLEEQKNFKPIPSYASMFQQFNNAEKTLVLNFNYTNCVTEYCKSYDKIKVINIHGELSNTDNPIIFGYAAKQEDTRELSNKNNDEYLKNIKQKLYTRTNYYNQLTDYLDKVKKIDVSVFGHSCGLSDNLILNKIFTHSNVTNIRVFYFKDYEPYRQSHNNIDRIMNDDENSKRLINYQDSYSMPQHTDNNQEVDFTKYINRMLSDQKNAKIFKRHSFLKKNANKNY